MLISLDTWLKNMDSNEITNRLNLEGFSQSAIAEVLGCSPSLISKVINRRARSAKVAVAISKLIKFDVLKVFPEYQMLIRRHERSATDTKKMIRKILNHYSG